MKRWIAAFVALWVAFTGWAQSTIRVDVHNIVELSERFNVVFTVEGEHAPSDFQWSPGDDFTLVWGPQKGTSTSVSIVNGKTTRSSQTSYTYILQAKKTGTLTATVKGDQIRSRTVQVTVVEGRDEGAQAQAQGGSAQGGGQLQARPSSSADTGELFMRLYLSKRDAMVGEPITATLKIYQRANLTGFEDAKFPKFNGFWSQEVDTPQSIEFQREQVGDKMYNAAVLRRWVLIPQKAGNLTIDPSEIVCLVNVRTQRPRTGSIFDDFFENDYVTQRQRVSTPAMTVKVSALPGGAPAGFSGAVGEYSVSAKLSKDALKTHDAASLIVTVTGKGNVSLVEAPKIVFPPDFEVYDVKATSATDKGGINGSKTFEYPFIPRSPGDFVLPPVRFSYYDVKSRRYATAQTDSLRLTVERGAGGAAQPAPDGAGTLTVDRKGVKNLGEDIRFIKTKTSLSEDKGFFVGKPAYWILVALLLLGAAAVWLSLRKLAARRADVAGSRNRKATREALKRLKLAGDFLGKNLYTAFYEELHRALVGFVADKLTMDRPGCRSRNSHGLHGPAGRLRVRPLRARRRTRGDERPLSTGRFRHHHHRRFYEERCFRDPGRNLAGPPVDAPAGGAGRRKLSRLAVQGGCGGLYGGRLEPGRRGLVGRRRHGPPLQGAVFQPGQRVLQGRRDREGHPLL